MPAMLRISFDELKRRVERVLLRLGLGAEGAALSARLIAETDRDGVRTHGIARLPRFAEMVRLRRIDPCAAPERVVTFGALERWTGHRGPGNLAAFAMTTRAVALAREHGVGVVALGDTNHWQRGGTYGWQAAEEGCAMLAWTNTMPNLPPWGATSPALGNNPLVVAVPRGLPASLEPSGVQTGGSARADGPVVLDMAMSQFSYGTLKSYRQRGELLPTPGGYDERGELTRDPLAIERSQRALPAGLWKGSGLAFVLDLLAAMLAGGRATHEIAADPLQETGLSQIFLAIAPGAVSAQAEMGRVMAGCIAALRAADPVEAFAIPRYPGEGVLRARAKSEAFGVGMEDAAWTSFLRLEQAAGLDRS